MFRCADSGRSGSGTGPAGSWDQYPPIPAGPSGPQGAAGQPRVDTSRAAAGPTPARAGGGRTLSPSHYFAESSGDETFRPYRHLAVRVLARALQDLTNPAGLATHRESARVFFAGSSMLSHWCRVAALDPRWITDRAGKLPGCGAGRLDPDPCGAVPEQG